MLSDIVASAAKLALPQALAAITWAVRFLKLPTSENLTEQRRLPLHSELLEQEVCVSS